jgi:Methyltransferase domain
VAHALVRRAARRNGLAVIRDDYYSPLVDASRLPPETWDREAPMPGLELDLGGALALIEQRLAPLIAEFHPPVHELDQPLGFYLDNPMYGPMDAHILYAMLRLESPKRVLELGSGYSTLVIQQALSRNPSPCEHVLVDPHPSPLVSSLPAVEVRTESAASTPKELFVSLDAGDVLFVDTSHVVRPGGEVVRLVLELLPTLAAGVVVHFHDIYRPYEYPRVFYDVFNVHWQEQYLLQAFLAFNERYRVVCPNHALWRRHRERMLHTFPGLHPGREPSGFWLERTVAS